MKKKSTGKAYFLAKLYVYCVRLNFNCEKLCHKTSWEWSQQYLGTYCRRILWNLQITIWFDSNRIIFKKVVTDVALCISTKENKKGKETLYSPLYISEFSRCTSVHNEVPVGTLTLCSFPWCSSMSTKCQISELWIQCKCTKGRQHAFRAERLKGEPERTDKQHFSWENFSQSSTLGVSMLVASCTSEIYFNE